MTRHISVVVPAWNRADLLPDTLDCILAQDTPAAEVIVVDDGSTDDTPALLARYAPRVRVIRTANRGDLAARNTGLEAASSELVAFCDSDDLWKPDFLSAMASMWRAEPGLRAAYGDFRIVRDGTWFADTKFTGAPPRFWDGLREIGDGIATFDKPVFPRLLDYQPFFPSALVADRAFFTGAGGWDEGTTGLVGRDFATALRMAEHAPLGILQRALVGVRKHGRNDSGDTLAMELGDAATLEYVLRTRPAYASHAEAVVRSVAVRRRRALDTAFARGMFEQVREITNVLPRTSLTPATRAKSFVAALPAPVRVPIARALLSLGTRRAAKSS